MKQAVNVLGRSGWFAEVPRDLQVSLLSRCDQIDLRAGGPVYRQGDLAGGIYGVVSGEVELHLPYLQEDKSLCHIAGAGYWFGDLAAVSGQVRRLDVRARVDSQLVRLSRAEMVRLFEKYPEGWKHLAAMLASNLALTLSYVEAMKAENVLVRVRAVLKALAIHPAGEAAVLKVSQDEIAAIASLSRKSTNAALKQLEKTGEITLQYRTIKVNGLQ